MTQKYFLKECVLRIHKFLQFFTVFWGDVEGAGTFTPSPPPPSLPLKLHPEEPHY